MKNCIFNLVKGFAFLSLLFLLPSCLDIVLFESPETARNGQSINVKVRIKTDADTDGFRVFFALSLDPIYDKEDIILKRDSSFIPLTPFSYADVNTSLTIPSNTFAGKYYLLAIPCEIEIGGINLTHFIYRYEANVSYKPITITGLTNNGNDIQPSNVYVYSPKRIAEDYLRQPSGLLSNTPIIKGNIRITYSLENRGFGGAGESQTYFFIVKDNRWFLLGTMVESTLVGNGRWESAFERNLLGYGFTSGTATLHLFTDFNGSVAEAREDNNLITKQIYIDASPQSNAPPVEVENIALTSSEKERLNKALLAANLKAIDEESLGNTPLSAQKEAKNAALPLTLTLFPNPTTDKVTVSFYQEKEGDVSLQLFDISGKMLHILSLPQLPVGQYQQDIPLHSLGKGTYIVKCQSGGKMSAQKLIVK